MCVCMYVCVCDCVCVCVLSPRRMKESVMTQERDMDRVKQYCPMVMSMRASMSVERDMALELTSLFISINTHRYREN